MPIAIGASPPRTRQVYPSDFGLSTHAPRIRRGEFHHRLLVPGVVFKASQTWPADLESSNKVTLTYDQAYTFTNQTAGAQTGTLYITEDRTLPLVKDASVGIGMSGAGTFVVQAQPNLNLLFTPHPVYWITFGDFEVGEVLDIENITNVAQVAFPPNIFTMLAVLNADNTWSVSPMP